ncbi:hypothetical protein OXYTRIMIC_471 [Oxytricha trifallax]|uniref:Ubiquitin-like protease family profile domain-containing protein n=1 Tax=Oxytricha trifallax TaxID=1172189 RepID=A0A073HX78_9SPIT|nr:hypothetical protein OXYTRIMIC_471 [Oxytricha trifallax]
MNKSSFSELQEEEKQSNLKDRFTGRQRYDNEKKEFWRKVQEVRYNHRDRSRDQEALGIRNEEKFKVPLNKQMGFKSRLKIGKSNPSKKLHESKNQRIQFDKHEDGSVCVLGDQMKFKKTIDLSEVTCQGFDKIIYAKKGWNTQVTRMVTIVCCPSARTRLEKALIKKYEDRREARRSGVRERDLWSEKQHDHWKEINQDWRHFDLIPGNHISEETMEAISQQMEEVQFSQNKLRIMIMPPIVMNDKGIQSLEKIIGSVNWKLDNGKYWRDTEEVEGVVIPTSCQSNLKNCKNWVILKIEKGAKTLEIHDTRKSIGSLAIIQKHLGKLSELLEETIGKEFKIDKLSGLVNTNQVKDPEDCGIMAILISNHIVMELQGEPVFQIFAKDWINMQRYYMMTWKSGIALSDEEMARDTEKKNDKIWEHANEGLESETYIFNSQIDQWEEVVMREDPRGQIERELAVSEDRFSELIGEIPEVEGLLFGNKVELQQEKREEETVDMNIDDNKNNSLEGAVKQSRVIDDQGGSGYLNQEDMNKCGTATFHCQIKTDFTNIILWVIYRT